MLKKKIILETTHGSHFWSVPSQFEIFWSHGLVAHGEFLVFIHRPALNIKTSAYKHVQFSVV